MFNRRGGGFKSRPLVPIFIFLLGVIVRIKQIESQNRRDFVAIFECEHCGHELKRIGYDDDYFHKTVIPAMPCSNCGKTAGDEYIPMEPKYPAYAVV